jgi:hypothetical protein
MATVESGNKKKSGFVIVAQERERTNCVMRKIQRLKTKNKKQDR